MAGLTKIPAIVKNLDDKESSKVALIENLQRKDLTPIEEARTYQKILELEGAMTQEELAATMGKTQSSVSNKLRLLALPEEIQDALLKEKISERHARSLLNINDKNEQIKMMERIVAEKMTVRELDKIIKEMNEGTTGGAAPTITTAEAPTSPSIVQPATTTPNVVIENNSLSATDILNASKLDGEDVNPFDEFKKVKENLNPTAVDVDKIRENAVDINQINKEVSTEAKEDGFKFVPTFGMNYKNNVTSDNTNTTGDNKFSQESPAQPENNNIASNVEQIGMVIESQPKGFKNAVDNIKSAVDNLKNSGYDISLNEFEGVGDYQITISIKKDA